MTTSRRRFLMGVAVTALWPAVQKLRADGTNYHVGVAHLSNAYEATQRAVAASGEWPVTRIAGRTVIIKTNVVGNRTSDTGQTTDPQVVRALVDLALADGAARVLIVERVRANLIACGYGMFDGYDPRGRVTLVDLDDLSCSLTTVPGGSAFQALFLPDLVLANDVVFVSAAKLKTHNTAMATLTLKNLFGLAPVAPYQTTSASLRLAFHERSVAQTIVDVNLTRPVDFAVIDGIWGMEGNGPLYGNPVRADVLLAGGNAVAVDRVGCMAMNIPQHRVQHLALAATKGIGPANPADLALVGDDLPVCTFATPVPDIAPLIDPPQVSCTSFSPSKGEHVDISYAIDRSGRTRAEILRAPDTEPVFDSIRVLHDWSAVPAGMHTLTWDGRDDKNHLVPEGRYTVRIQSDTGPYTREGHSVCWVQVAAASRFYQFMPSIHA